MSTSKYESNWAWIDRISRRVDMSPEEFRGRSASECALKLMRKVIGNPEMEEKFNKEEKERISVIAKGEVSGK